MTSRSLSSHAGDERGNAELFAGISRPNSVSTSRCPL